MNFNSDIEACLHILHNGGIILYPTDTIWGIGCDATNEDAVEKIIQLKQRVANKNFIVLVSDEKELMQYVAALDLEIFNYLETQKKPTTVIYHQAIGLANSVIAEDGSVAIRICKDEFCKTLIKRFRKPIVSTSANISNQPSPKLFLDISNEIKNGVDYVVAHKQNDQTPSTPSSIIEWKNGEIINVR
ncbi:MAG TPA: L-threonylcarbamoyladenylate synthase [Chitinophagaceae bacterium]|nr:L-threonylcarbamoyladenylate synthase [Chitinophagaceae bacterium]HNE94316.1 L-threonylcarbamoyladenylate synthase [Chitinophagaceae bacterium]HNF30188.1 L-threonylcarbamoyladenylate synthase [Chitinophagaceae bacterium]HNJ57992.1 L-threonylcarbamoyladenylate synthase [Chitinophagaceae bacterium]HNM34748.1 L-threonylcarbamoyladenylate synthase [Chitinophagaceae bacterium]